MSAAMVGGRIRGNCVVVTQSMAATGPWHRIIASIYCYCYDMLASHLDGIVGGVGVGGVGGGGGVNVYGRPWSWSMVHVHGDGVSYVVAGAGGVRCAVCGCWVDQIKDRCDVA